jgi:hypothetical protein
MDLHPTKKASLNNHNYNSTVIDRLAVFIPGVIIFCYRWLKDTNITRTS